MDLPFSLIGSEMQLSILSQSLLTIICSGLAISFIFNFTRYYLIFLIGLILFMIIHCMKRRGITIPKMLKFYKDIFTDNYSDDEEDFIDDEDDEEDDDDDEEEDSNNNSRSTSIESENVIDPVKIE